MKTCNKMRLGANLIRQTSSAALLVASMSVLTHCSDKFMSSKVKNESTGSLNLAATADAAGNYTGAMDPNSTSTQVLRATSGDLSGSAIAMPPGALAINLSVTIGSGETLASSDTTQQLGLGDNSASAAGPAVSFVPSTNVQASNPFTLSIPVSSTSLALSALDNDNLVVMYKWMKVDNGVVSYAIGIIPRDSLTVGSKTVQFQTTKFGTFQLAVTQTKITEPVSKPTVEPPVLKADASNPLVGVWSQCNSNYYSSSSTNTGTSTTGTGTTVDSNAIIASINQQLTNIQNNESSLSTPTCSVSTHPTFTFFVHVAPNLSGVSLSVAGVLSTWSGGVVTRTSVGSPDYQSATEGLNYTIDYGASPYNLMTNYPSPKGDQLSVVINSPECHFGNLPGFKEKYMDNNCAMGPIDIYCDGLTMQNIYDQAIANATANLPPPPTSTATTGSNNNGGGRDGLGVLPGAKTYSREYVKFSSSTFIHSRSVFSDANCTGTMINRVEESGTYKLGAMTADSTYPIAITFGGSFATILTQPGVDFANGNPTLGGCGYSDWAVGTARDITNSTCQKDNGGGGKSGPTIVKVQGNNIYFNDSGSTTVNTKDTMTRQQ